MMKLLSYLVALVLSLSPAGQDPAGLTFNATLTSIKINGRPGEVVTRQFRLTLDPNQPSLHFKAKVEDWWRSEDGHQSFYAEPGTLRRSCARWASINPVESAVGPSETLTVRITVALPRELAPGGYWCALTVDQVADPLAPTDAVGVRFVASVSTGIFVYVDPVRREAEIADLQVQPDRALIKVRNDGNAPLGVEGRLEFFAPGSKRATATVDVPRSTLLTEPFKEGIFETALPPASILPSGRYLVRAVLDIGADHDIGAEREVDLLRGSQPGGSIR